MKIAPERLAELDRINLAVGHHSSFDDGVCAMELVAWLANEPHSDRPKCVSPILSAFLRQWNDDLDDDDRQMLKPYLPRVVGTAGDGHDELRGWLCADWLIRVYTPVWFDLAGAASEATALASLAPIRDLASLKAASPSYMDGRHQATDNAWNATRAATRYPVWVAAAGDAARAAARIVVGHTVSWNVARDVVAWIAVSDAARDALNLTKVELQASALELLERLIDPTKADGS